MFVIHICILLSLLFVDTHQQESDVPEWLQKHLNGGKIEYTAFNEVSIVHNTKLNFEEFWKIF